jgi:hypothetical protein
MFFGWILVVHIYNLSYLGGWDGEDCGSRLAWANSLGDPISKITRAKCNSVALGVEHLLCKCDAEFKPQSHQNKTRSKNPSDIKNSPLLNFKQPVSVCVYVCVCIHAFGGRAYWGLTQGLMLARQALKFFFSERVWIWSPGWPGTGKPQSSCLCLLSAGIAEVYHHTPHPLMFLVSLVLLINIP